MQTPSTHTSFMFTRQPLSALSKTTAIALFVSGALCAFIWAMTEQALGLGIIAVGQLLIGAFILLGIGWLPLLGSLMSAVILWQFAIQPYVGLHLTNPKQLFTFFVVIVLILACSVVSLGAGIAATMQNVSQREQAKRPTPRWLTAALTGMIGVVVGALLIGALAPASTPASTASAVPSNIATVHVGPNTFDQSSITIQKGSKLLIADTNGSFHILANGSWANGQPQHTQEAGAPTINNVSMNSGNVEIGPFTTAGTYHIYCTLHQGMNLTIIVQ
jgi:plastocyanin